MDQISIVVQHENLKCLEIAASWVIYTHWRIGETTFDGTSDLGSRNDFSKRQIRWGNPCGV